MQGPATPALECGRTQVARLCRGWRPPLGNHTRLVVFKHFECHKFVMCIKYIFENAFHFVILSDLLSCVEDKIECI